MLIRSPLNRVGGVDSVGVWVREWCGSNFGVGSVSSVGTWNFCLGDVVAWVEILVWVAWVHKILAWVGWVKIFAWVAWLAWVKKAAWVNVLLLYNYTNRIHQALQHTYFISCFFNPNETCVGCIFRFIFKFVLPRLFCKLWLSLLLNIQKQ